MDEDDREAFAQAVYEQAIDMGIDPSTEPHLLRVAEAMLRAPLPEGWVLVEPEDETAAAYYFNQITIKSQWEHPLHGHFQEMIAEFRKSMSPLGATRVDTEVREAPETFVSDITTSDSRKSMGGDDDDDDDDVGSSSLAGNDENENESPISAATSSLATSSSIFSTRSPNSRTQFESSLPMNAAATSTSSSSYLSPTSPSSLGKPRPSPPPPLLSTSTSSPKHTRNPPLLPPPSSSVSSAPTSTSTSENAKDSLQTHIASPAPEIVINSLAGATPPPTTTTQALATSTNNGNVEASSSTDLKDDATIIPDTGATITATPTKALATSVGAPLSTSPPQPLPTHITTNSPPSRTGSALMNMKMNFDDFGSSDDDDDDDDDEDEKEEDSEVVIRGIVQPMSYSASSSTFSPVTSSPTAAAETPAAISAAATLVPEEGKTILHQTPEKRGESAAGSIQMEEVFESPTTTRSSNGNSLIPTSASADKSTNQIPATPLPPTTKNNTSSPKNVSSLYMQAREEHEQVLELKKQVASLESKLQVALSVAPTFSPRNVKAASAITMSTSGSTTTTSSASASSSSSISNPLLSKSAEDITQGQPLLQLPESVTADAIASAVAAALVIANIETQKQLQEVAATASIDTETKAQEIRKKCQEDLEIHMQEIRKASEEETRKRVDDAKEALRHDLELKYATELNTYKLQLQQTTQQIEELNLSIDHYTLNVKKLEEAAQISNDKIEEVQALAKKELIAHEAKLQFQHDEALRLRIAETQELAANELKAAIETANTRFALDMKDQIDQVRSAKDLEFQRKCAELEAAAQRKLQQTIDKLQHEHLQEVRKATSAAAEEIQKIQSEVDMTKQEQQLMTEKSASEIRSLQETIQLVQRETTQSHAETLEARQEIDIHRSRATQAEARVTELSMKLQSTNEELHRTKDQFKQLKDELSSVQDKDVEKGKLLAELQQRRDEIEACNVEIATLRAARDVSQATFTSELQLVQERDASLHADTLKLALQTKDKEVEKTIESLKQQLRQRETMLQEQQAAFRSQLQILQEKENTLVAARDALQENLQLSHRTGIETALEASSAKEEISRLTLQKKELSKQVEEAASRERDFASSWIRAAPAAPATSATSATSDENEKTKSNDNNHDDKNNKLPLFEKKNSVNSLIDDVSSTSISHPFPPALFKIQGQAAKNEREEEEREGAVMLAARYATLSSTTAALLKEAGMLPPGGGGGATNVSTFTVGISSSSSFPISSSISSLASAAYRRSTRIALDEEETEKEQSHYFGRPSFPPPIPPPPPRAAAVTSTSLFSSQASSSVPLVPALFSSASFGHSNSGNWASGRLSNRSNNNNTPRGGSSTMAPVRTPSSSSRPSSGTKNHASLTFSQLQTLQSPSFRAIASDLFAVKVGGVTRGHGMKY